MAISTPKTFGIELTTSAQRIMHDVVPASTVRHITAIQLTSIDPSNEALATVQWIDASNADAAQPLLWQAPVPVADAIPAIVGAISLEAGDDLTGLSSANGDIHCTVCYYDESI